MLGLDTPWLRVLIAARDARGVFRVLVGPQAARPGLVMEWKLGVNVRKQVAAFALRHMPGATESLRLDVFDPLTPHVATDDGQPALLILAAVPDDSYQAPEAWSTYPALLAGLPADRSRLPYLKAFQLLSGAHEQALSALPVDEEVREALRAHLAREAQTPESDGNA